MTDSLSVGRRALNTARLAALAAVERRVPFWPPERVERRQRRHLAAIVRHAYESVPFYRETMDRLGLQPADIATAADLARLPIVERELVQREPDLFLSSAHRRDRALPLRSGGSTGAPRVIRHDPAALLANAAHGERDRAVYLPLLGRRVGYRETDIAARFSSAAAVRGAVQSLVLLPAPIRIERQYLAVLDPPAALAREIERFKPDVLHGFGSSLGLLFAHYQATGAHFHRPRAITFSADALPETARQTIAEEYGIPAFGAYQAIEALKIGFECERCLGYHLNTDLYPIRIVDPDGRTLPAGESGEVIVSNLVNRATVLLNYRIGDLATLATEPCPCGRSLPLLASLDGRRDDLISLPSGRVVYPQALRGVFTAEPAVWQYQVVQEAPLRFTATVVLATGANRDAIRERLLAGLADRLVDPVAFDLAFVAEIARTPGGKVRTIVSRCPPSTAGAAPAEIADD